MTNGLRVRLGQAPQDIARHDQHAGRAKSALQRVTFVEMPAQHFHRWIVAQPLKREDRASVAHHRQRQA